MTRRPQLCPKCRKLVGAEDEQCHQCGANLGMRGRLLHGARAKALGAGSGMPWWRIVLIANLVLYAVGVLVTLRSGANVTGGGLFGMLGASDSVQWQLGIQVKSLVLAGEYWRMVTCLFLHANIIHVGFNMYFLAQLGPTAEQIFGNRGFLLVYILGGLAGSAVEVVLGNRVLGASGSIMALIGALAGLGMLRARTWDNDLTREMLKILAFVTLFGLMVGSVAHGAHIGGFIGGGLVLALVQRLQAARLHQVLDGLGYGTAALVVVSFALMGANLNQPTLDELAAYERCVHQGIQPFDGKPSKAAAALPKPACLAELAPHLPEVPSGVLLGLEELWDKPQAPNRMARAHTLWNEHLTWLRAEVNRMGLGR